MPLVGNNGFALRNNLHFIEKAREMKIDPGMVMVSFDVKALYTSLPIERTMNVVRYKLESDDTLHQRWPLSVQDILALSKVCLKSTYFTFRGKFFHLTEGVAMRSPVSSVVVNLFMEDFEERAMAEAGNLHPSSWDRYVDDVFSICKKDDA